MNGHGESDRVIVPGKPPNNEEKAGKVPVDESAEEVEGRTLAKENLRQQNTHRTRGRKRVHSVLARVRRAAEGSAWGVSSSTAGTHHSGSTTPIPTTGSASESEAGAQCGSPARWDLCGGRPERAVPTATACTFRCHRVALEHRAAETAASQKDVFSEIYDSVTSSRVFRSTASSIGFCR